MTPEEEILHLKKLLERSVSPLKMAEFFYRDSKLGSAMRKTRDLLDAIEKVL